jgi:hypothetical protein
MKNNYNIGDKFNVVHYYNVIGCIITDSTPSKIASIEITEVLQPREPLTPYSEPRYNYKHLNENITGNIGEGLLSRHIIQ